MMRLVLDTNVWLDWLVFHDAGVAAIKDAVASQRATVFLSHECEAELARVLSYSLSGRVFNADEQAALLVQCRAVAQRITAEISPHRIEGLPRCADPDDQKFLELARDCGANLLIT